MPSFARAERGDIGQAHVTHGIVEALGSSVLDVIFMRVGSKNIHMEKGPYERLK